MLTILMAHSPVSSLTSGPLLLSLPLAFVAPGSLRLALQCLLVGQEPRQRDSSPCFQLYTLCGALGKNYFQHPILFS
jgi:hypothetical protein